MSWNISQDLTNLGIIHKEYSKGYICHCPFAPWTHAKGTDNSKSLVIWPDIDFFQCYACGMKGSYHKFLSEYHRLSNDPEAALLLKVWNEDTYRLKMELRKVVETKTRKVKEYFDDDLLQTFPDFRGTPAEEYLEQDRGYDLSVCDTFGLRWDPRQKRVIFPVRDKHGLLGMIGRSIEDNPAQKHLKYFCDTATFLGGEDHFSDNPKLIVVEGFTDMLNIYPWANEEGYDTCCTWTANISSSQVDLIAGSGKVPYCYFDQDKAGEHGWTELRSMYPSRLIFRVYWSFLNSKGQVKDSGEFTKDEFRKTL